MRYAIFAIAITFIAIITGCDDETTPVNVQKVDTLASVVSPADDWEAECLAVVLSRQRLAPKWLYDRIHADLAEIRVIFSDSTLEMTVKARPWPNLFRAKVDSLIINMHDSASRHILDSAFAANHLEFYQGWRDSTSLYCSSTQRPFMYEVMKELTIIPGIVELNNNYMSLDHSDVYVWRDRNSIKYFWYFGAGDCPAGCAYQRLSYLISDERKMTFIATLVPSDSTCHPCVRPTWLDTFALATCQKDLGSVWKRDSGWIEVPSQCSPQTR